MEIDGERKMQVEAKLFSLAAVTLQSLCVSPPPDPLSDRTAPLPPSIASLHQCPLAAAVVGGQRESVGQEVI